MGDLRIEYCPTGEMVADFFTKLLQGSIFRKLRKVIMNLPDDTMLSNATASQECVGTNRSYSDVVQGTTGKSSNMTDAVRQPTVNGKW
jgi:hypothetical protein